MKMKKYLFEDRINGSKGRLFSAMETSSIAVYNEDAILFGRFANAHVHTMRNQPLIKCS